ncbi:hypothetical protein D9619_012005 [Psilocybe cf. subviscida]|uniref:Uncharacterized protein n=1 Tax=Psilocybe cf. subviscida TaxID=2480587 RepID=A0A8H5B0G6_9AGAR|nr:hypothetical protein D9619_012005 [Psilocybe cf. subviscida]
MSTLMLRAASMSSPALAMSVTTDTRVQENTHHPRRETAFSEFLAARAVNTASFPCVCDHSAEKTWTVSTSRERMGGTGGDSALAIGSSVLSGVVVDGASLYLGICILTIFGFDIDIRVGAAHGVGVSTVVITCVRVDNERKYDTNRSLSNASASPCITSAPLTAAAPPPHRPRKSPHDVTSCSCVDTGIGAREYQPVSGRTDVASHVVVNARPRGLKIDVWNIFALTTFAPIFGTTVLCAETRPVPMFLPLTSAAEYEHECSRGKSEEGREVLEDIEMEEVNVEAGHPALEHEDDMVVFRACSCCNSFTGGSIVAVEYEILAYYLLITNAVFAFCTTRRLRLLRKLLARTTAHY